MRVLNPLAPTDSYPRSGAHLLVYALLLTTGLVLAVCPSAPAHKVHVFAYTEGDTVRVEGYFSDGSPARGGTLTVLDADGETLLQGSPDEEGRFSFSRPPAHEAVTIVLDAGMGHRGTYRLQLVESDTPPESAPEPSSAGTIPAPVGSSVSATELETLIRRTVREELSPLQRDVARLSQNRVSVTEVAGGIGYIVGITGLILYLHERRR